MLKKALPLLLIGAFLTAGLPVQIFPAEGTKQSVIAAQEAPCKAQKTVRAIDSHTARPDKTPLAVQRILPGEKHKKTYRKWYICAGIAVAAGIVSYYRLQPDSPFDYRR